jgi:hypothetical protein
MKIKTINFHSLIYDFWRSNRGSEMEVEKHSALCIMKRKNALKKFQLPSDSGVNKYRKQRRFCFGICARPAANVSQSSQQ